MNTLRELLESQALRLAEKVYLFSEPDGCSFTYAEFDTVVNRTANLLLSLGVEKGDRVALLLPNSAEYIIAYFACFKIGAIAGPVNTHLKAEELEYVVGNAESVVALTNAKLLPGLRAVRPRLHALREIVLVGHREEETRHFESEIEQQSESLQSVELAPDDEAFIIYTSGTTGKSKGVLLTHRNLLANARHITSWLGLDERDRILCVMPLFHVNAVMTTMMSSMLIGGTEVVVPRFSVSHFWEVVERHRVTTFGSVATMLSLLNQKYPGGVDGQYDISSLRFALCGSAPVPVPVMEEFERKFGCLVVEGYGLSESTCRATFNPPNQSRRPGSIGKPIGAEVKILDDEDRELPPGQAGEIAVRGEEVMKGYFRNPEATAKALRNGWLHTGDIGYRDEEGFFYIVDRKSDMIVRAGENIYPREIDDVLYRHPAVKDAATIGVPDPLFGEEVKSFVVLRDGEVLTAEELIEYCHQHLADYKCPKTIEFLPDIPKGPTGKLLKRELAARYVQKRD